MENNQNTNNIFKNIEKGIKEKLKDEAKDKVKKRIIAIIIKIVVFVFIKVMIPIIIAFIIVSAIIKFLKVDAGAYQDGNYKNTNYVVAKNVTSKLDTSEIENGVSGYKLNIDLDAKVEEVIKTLEAAENDSSFDGDLTKISTLGTGKGTKVETYLSEGNRKEYLKDFIKAEIVTQYPDFRDNPDDEPIEGELQGVIKIKRAQSDGNTKTLTYVDQDTFNSYIDMYNNNGDTTATNHFTLNSNGDLIVAKWNKTKTTFSVDNGGDTLPDTNNPSNNEEYKPGTETTYVMSEVSINYKSIVEKYSMPFDFLWALLVMTEDEEFVHDLSKLALDSEIVFTVNDNKTTIKTEDVYTYKKQTKSKTTVNSIVTATIDESSISKNYKKEGENEDSPIDYKITKTVEEEDTNPVIDLTYANTWIAEYKNNYTNKIENEKKEVKDPIKKNDIAYKKTSEEQLTKQAYSQEQMLSDSFVNSALEEAKTAMRTEKESEILEKEIEKLLEQKISEQDESNLKEKILKNVISEVKSNILTAIKEGNYSDDLFRTWNINNRIDSYKSKCISEMTKGMSNNILINSIKGLVNSVKNDEIIDLMKELINSVNSMNREEAVTKNIKGEVESVKYEYYRRTTNQEINTAITTNCNRYTRRNTNCYRKNGQEFSR